MNPAVIKSYAVRLAGELNVKRVPMWKAEQEIISILIRVCRTLAPAAVFGYHTVKDIEQQGIIFGLEILDAVNDIGEPIYDAERPLENFLHVHIRNRLSNYKRDNYIRTEPPCQCCPPFSPPAHPCQRWHDWHKRNFAKQNLMRPIDMHSVSDEGESRMYSHHDVEGEAIGNELEKLIDDKLPVDLRADYMRMRSHVTIPQARRNKVREAVAAIAREGGYLDAEEDY